jgi:hypothetical protein
MVAVRVRDTSSFPKVACSRTLKTVDWNNTRLARDAVTAVAGLKQQGEGVH